MPGPPRKPIEQRVKEGNRSQHALPDPVRIGGMPPAPREGSSDAFRAVWLEIVDAVGSFLDSADAQLVETLAREVLVAREAELSIDELGVLVEVRRVGRDGSELVRMEKNPAVDVARSARMEIRQLCDRFGIGPSARARLAGLGVVPGRVVGAPGEQAADGGIAGLGELRVLPPPAEDGKRSA